MKESDDKENVDPNPKSRTEGETFGKHATLPLLVSDNYAKVNLPDLQEFNPDDIVLDATIVAIGKRRTGKSWIFRNLMYLMKDKIDAGIVISQTDELNKFWQQYVPKKFIFKTYEPEVLQAVFNRQKGIMNDPQLTKAEKEKKAPFFVLLDDVISDHRIRYDKEIMELFVAGRHYKLFVLITTQYAKAITPTLRGNTDYVFMLKCQQLMQREALWQDFADFMTKDGFAQLLDTYTEDNECLVINTCPENGLSTNPLESCFWWKAVDPGKFKMGSKAYWQSAMNDASIPPQTHPQNVMDMIKVKSIMPRPYDQMV